MTRLEGTIPAGLAARARRIRADSLRTQFVAGVLGSMGLKGLNAVLMLAVSMTLARALGPHDYGIYAFALSVVAMLSLPATMGLPMLLVREVAKYHLQEDWRSLRGLLRRSNQAVLALSVALAAIAGALAVALPHRPEVLRLGVVVWALLLVPLTALGDVRGAVLRGLRRPVQGELPPMVVRPAILLVLLAATIGFGSLTPAAAVAANVVAAAGAFVIGAALMWRAMPAPVRAATPVYDTAAWGRSVLPLSMLVGLHALQSQIATLMLGLLSTSASVGTYRVALQLAGLVAFTLVAINTVIGPHIVRLYESREMDRLELMVRWSSRLILLIALPVSLVFVLFGRRILETFFGAEYGAASGALAILAVGHAIFAAIGPVGSLLTMTGHERCVVAALGAGVTANVVLNLILIPSRGIEGAAAATLVALLLSMGIMFAQVSRRIGIRPSPF